MKRLFLSFSLILVLCSCDSTLDGKQEDTIKLSTNKLWFRAKGGVDSITAKGERWYIEKMVKIGDTIMYPYQYDQRDTLIDRGNFWELYGSNIQYGMNEENFHDVIYIKGPWFAVDVLNKQKVIFSANQNETGEKRMFKIYLWDKNYYTYIEVSQSAD
ncbi:MAG: hypothetical protein LBU89_05920 [Fibromonadaceae bacterium]|jgi:hypothetical protein|nr:hypothetical protein [Fibromonadaceae bacterium]